MELKVSQARCKQCLKLAVVSDRDVRGSAPSYWYIIKVYPPCRLYTWDWDHRAGKIDMEGANSLMISPHYVVLLAYIVFVEFAHANSQQPINLESTGRQMKVRSGYPRLGKRRFLGTDDSPDWCANRTVSNTKHAAPLTGHLCHNGAKTFLLYRDTYLRQCPNKASLYTPLVWGGVGSDVTEKVSLRPSETDKGVHSLLPRAAQRETTRDKAAQT